MIFQDLKPTAIALHSLVQCYRLRHFIIPPNQQAQVKPFPAQPEQCIAFYPRGFEITEIHDSGSMITKPRSVISGQYTTRINRHTGTAEFLMIQVVFKPGALHKLTGIPFHELHNNHIDFEDLYRKQVSAINEQLANSTSYADMISIIESFFTMLAVKQRIQSTPADAVFDLLVQDPKKYSLKWLASEACLSIRQFERKANQYIGISPQLFNRVARFNTSYRRRLRIPNETWLTNAMACGYHDYQHLVKDYKEFACASPHQLFSEESKVIERTLGLNK